MAEHSLTRARSWSGLAAPLRIAVIYLAARVVTTAFLLLATQLSGPTSRFGATPSVADFAVGWDATWYWFLAQNGYPTTLPMTDAGLVAENQWAFMPLYAYLSAAVGALFGSWGAGAVLVSLAAGYGACYVLYRLLRMRLDASTATWAVAFFASGPLAALFQIGYAETLFLLWLFLALWMLQRRSWGWLYLLIPLMGFTRPGVLAFALTLGLYGIWRWTRRRSDPLPAREIIHIIVLGGWAVLVGFSWQLIAAVATGDPGAYLATELAWRRNWIGADTAAFVPFEGFFQAAGFWFTSWGMTPVVGYIACGVLALALAAVLVWDPRVRRLGMEVRVWSASYALYLFAVFFPQSSIFRLLVPLSPLWGAVAMPRSRLYRGSVLIVCLLGQWWWIYNMYALGDTYWRIP